MEEIRFTLDSSRIKKFNAYNFKVGSKEYNRILEALKQDRYAKLIQEIKPYPNDEMIYAVVDSNPNLVRHISNPTREILCYAVRKKSNAFRHIPKKLLDVDIIEALMEAESYTASIIDVIPARFRTQKLINHICNSNIEAFEFIPTKFQTQELADKYFEERVINNGSAIHIEFISKKFINCEMVDKFMKEVRNKNYVKAFLLESNIKLTDKQKFELDLLGGN